MAVLYAEPLFFRGHQTTTYSIHKSGQITRGAAFDQLLIMLLYIEYVRRSHLKYRFILHNINDAN